MKPQLATYMVNIQMVCPGFSGGMLLDFMPLDLEWKVVWDGVDTRRNPGARSWTWSSPDDPVAEVAHHLRGSDQTIYTWRRQDRIDRGLQPGLTSSEKTELTQAKQRIAELETELRATQRGIELTREMVSPKGNTRQSR